MTFLKDVSNCRTLAVLGYIIDHPDTRRVGTVFSLAVFERAQLVNGPRIAESIASP
jgi:hypothetical protein